MTQLKAYFIALGGDLASLLNNSPSVFDQMIKQNFDTHLELTILSNPDLICKYPHYGQVMANFMKNIGLTYSQLHIPEAIPLDLTLRYPS